MTTPLTEDSRRTHGAMPCTLTTGREGKGREGNRRGIGREGFALETSPSILTKVTREPATHAGQATRHEWMAEA